MQSWVDAHVNAAEKRMQKNLCDTSGEPEEGFRSNRPAFSGDLWYDSTYGDPDALQLGVFQDDSVRVHSPRDASFTTRSVPYSTVAHESKQNASFCKSWKHLFRGDHGKGVPMAKPRSVRIVQDQAVRLFATRLREVRLARGLSQVELGRRAHVTASYIWRLESAGASPGIDVVARLAMALETTSHDLMPASKSPETTTALVNTSDRELLLMLNQLLACLAAGP
jgi:transcriptional regulator with XRE-family HTH domain